MNCKKCGRVFTPSKGLLNYCSLKCRNSRVFSEESKEKKRKSNSNQIPWNKGKNWFKKKNSNTTTICLSCGKEISCKIYNKKKYHAECWLKSSGGYRKGSGVGKSGWYKGYWCDSSYELAWVIYNIEHNISFTRNKQKYEYYWDNKKKYYIPDFILNGEIIEIKGYLNKQTIVKLNLIPNLKILFKKDLIHVFEYVEGKYGKNFTYLYEDKKF